MKSKSKRERVTRRDVLILARVKMEAHFYFSKPFDQTTQTCPLGMSWILEKQGGGVSGGSEGWRWRSGSVGEEVEG